MSEVEPAFVEVLAEVGRWVVGYVGGDVASIVRQYYGYLYDLINLPLLNSVLKHIYTVDYCGHGYEWPYGARYSIDTEWLVKEINASVPLQNDYYKFVEPGWNSSILSLPECKQLLSGDLDRKPRWGCEQEFNRQFERRAKTCRIFADDVDEIVIILSEGIRHKIVIDTKTINPVIWLLVSAIGAATNAPKHLASYQNNLQLHDNQISYSGATLTINLPHTVWTFSQDIEQRLYTL
jgi:hypothetical protein